MLKIFRKATGVSVFLFSSPFFRPHFRAHRDQRIIVEIKEIEEKRQIKTAQSDDHASYLVFFPFQTCRFLRSLLYFSRLLANNTSFVSVNRFYFIFIKFDGIALFLMCTMYIER